MVYLVCEDFSDSKSDESCGEECKAIVEVLFFRLVYLSLSLKLSLSPLVTMAAIFALEATTMLKRAKTLLAALRRRWNLIFQVKI